MLDIPKLLSSAYLEVSPFEFYRDLFPVGSFETKGVYEDGKYNGIAVLIENKTQKTKRFTITDDLEKLQDMAKCDDFCLMSPISYAGKSRKSANARFLYGLAIDLDGIETMEQWDFFLQQIEQGHKMLSFIWGLPKPTYIVASGTGVHLYYVFKVPIPMFLNIVKQLELLKKRLTWQAWTQGASALQEKVQYESLFQGFRIVGTITKNGKRCRAFKVGDKIDIAYLNRYVPADYTVQSIIYQSNLRLNRAKELYPAWYIKRIVEKRPKQTWTCKRDLYHWWIRKLIEGAEQGHRYWCVMTLATYAKKCGVSREELEEDAIELIPILNKRGDKFTEHDVMHALEAYSDNYITYPIDTIVNRTGIAIKKNKRNGRKRKTTHQAYRLGMKNLKIELGENKTWNKGGRPSKQKIVEEWQKANPNGKKIECERDTNLSRHTVLKWWS